MRLSVLSACLVAFVLPGSAWAAGAKDRLVAGFEESGPGSVRVAGATRGVGRDRAQAAAGEGYLILRCGGRRSQARVTLGLPPGADVSFHRSLVLSIRATPTARPLAFRWLAQDGAGRVLFQRRFFFDGGGVWHRMEWPFALWRWGDASLGAWSEVRGFVLVVESQVWDRIHLDEVRLTAGRRGARSAYPEPGWVRRIAFGAENGHFLREGSFLLGWDESQITPELLAPLRGNLKPLPAWVTRVFGAEAKEVSPEKPVVLLIFQKRSAYRRFFERLGTSWRVNISAPRSGGYTVYDIATSYYDPKQGAERPVYFHEAVHALVARTLRLIPGLRAHSWLQEGIANYLQLCLYPRSLDSKAWETHFGRPIDPRGKTFFKPLRALLTRRIGTENYAQLASLTAFLLSRNQALLRDLAAGLARGRAVEDVLKDGGETFETLQEKWLAWGRATFREGAPAPAGPGTHFPVPREWRKDTAKEE